MSPRGYFRSRRNFNIAPFLRHFQATAGCKSLSQQTVARRIRLFAGKLVVGQPKPVESALQKGYNIYVMDSSFSRNLARLRKAAGLTLERLAEKLFVTRQAVSKWERDESRPDIDTVVAIAELFSVTTDQLLKGEVPTDSEINVAEIADGEGFRSSQRRKLARSMVIFALFECAALCPATGVLFTSLIGIAEHIWLAWLTLPVLAPLIGSVDIRYSLLRRVRRGVVFVLRQRAGSLSDNIRSDGAFRAGSIRRVVVLSVYSVVLRRRCDVDGRFADAEEGAGREMILHC